MTLLWVRNTEGRPDATLTMALLAFVVVLLKYLVAGVVITAAGHDVNLGTSDAAAIAALLTPTLGAYVARRHTDKKFQPDTVDSAPVDDGSPAEGKGAGAVS